MKYAHCSCCGFAISAVEARYYGDRCESCERDEHERIQQWRAGASDVQLDRKFGDTPPTVHN